MSLVKNGTIETQSRWRSLPMWTSLVACLLTLMGHLGLYEAFNIDQTFIQKFIDGLLTLLFGFGILNNPTNKTGF